MAIALDDLVHPLGYERFVTEHWMAEVPFLSDPNPKLVAALREIEAFQSPEALVSRLTRNVGLLGPKHFRADVPPHHAINFMKQGYVLYMTELEEQIPEVRMLSNEVASQLGATNLGLGVESFIAVAGSVSTVHFDYDINFQILLEGEKRWHVAPNQQIRNPLQSYHPTQQNNYAINTCIEEAYARDPAIKPELPAGARVYEARPGSTMFVPRAWWHEVESLTACFGVNFIMKGSTWALGLTQALCDVLHGDEAGREWCYGALAGSPELKARSAHQFEDMKRRAITELQKLTLEEVYLGGRNGRFVWTPEASERSLVETADGWALVAPGVSEEPLGLDGVLVGLLAKLVPLHHPFAWEHLAVLARDEIRGPIGAVGLWNVLADLAEAGYLQRLPGR